MTFVNSLKIGVQPFIWKCIFLAQLLSNKSDSFPCERLYTRTCFETEGKIATEKRLIGWHEVLSSSSKLVYYYNSHGCPVSANFVFFSIPNYFLSDDFARAGEQCSPIILMHPIQTLN